MANPLNTAGKVATPKKYPTIPTSSPVPSPSLANNQANNPGIPKSTPVPTPRNTAPQMAIPKNRGTVPPVQDTSSYSRPTSYPPIPTNSTPVPTPPTQPTTFSNPQYNDWMTKQNEMFSNLEKQINTPFNYDPNTDAALQSQKVLYDQSAAKATQNALESANDRGIMGSSMNLSQMAQIQQDASHQFNALIPQYQQQAYGQYQDKLANAGQLLSQSMNLRNNQFNEGITEANLTGSYMPAGAQQLVNQIYNLKSQAETKGITAGDRSALSTQADQIRQQLTAMGVDVSGLGADTSLAKTSVGQRTLAGQQLDYTKQADQRDYDEGVRQFDMQFGEGVRQYDQGFQQARERYAVADQQWKSEFNERVKQNGIDAAINWAQVGISQQNANTSSGNLALNRDEFNYRKTQGSSSGGSSKSSSSSSGSTKVDAKSSIGEYNNFNDDLSSIPNKELAREILSTYIPFMTDSDYRKANDAIDKKFSTQ